MPRSLPRSLHPSSPTLFAASLLVAAALPACVDAEGSDVDRASQLAPQPDAVTLPPTCDDPRSDDTYDFIYESRVGVDNFVRAGRLDCASKELALGDGELILSALSPDGKRVAVATSPRGKHDWNLRVVNLSDGAAVDLDVDIDPGFGLNVSWSPDGETIAYQATRPSFALAVVSSSGGQSRMLADVDGPMWGAPDWSPDGGTILFAHGARLESILADGTDRRAVGSETGGSYANPQWSPDGESVAYERASQPTHTLERLALDSAAPVVLADLNVSMGGASPRWSPDGKTLAFVNAGSIPGNLALYTVPAGGGEVAALDEHPDEYVFHLAWSPDGSTIRYTSMGNVGGLFHPATIPSRGGLRRDIGISLGMELGHVDWFPQPMPLP